MLNYNQVRHMQAWCVPKTMMTNLSNKYNADAEMYCDHSAYYRESELPHCKPAWGGLLSGPSWNRFVVWWHENYRMVNLYSEAEKMEKGYRITKLFENETWEYVHGISHGLTKFVAPSEDVNYRQLNYLILQTCNYYHKYDSRHWKSPLLQALEDNAPLPTTTAGEDIPPTAEGDTTNYDIIDNLGTSGMPNFRTMEEGWKEAKKTITLERTVNDVKTTRDPIRSGDMRAKSARSRL